MQHAVPPNLHYQLHVNTLKYSGQLSERKSSQIYCTLAKHPFFVAWESRRKYNPVDMIKPGHCICEFFAGVLLNVFKETMMGEVYRCTDGIDVGILHFLR